MSFLCGLDEDYIATFEEIANKKAKLIKANSILSKKKKLDILIYAFIMGRFEAFALGNGPWRAFLDGIGNAFGYAVILLIVGFFRELLGSGTLFGVPVLGDPIEKTGLYSTGYENNGFMLMPPMALIIVGLIIWVQRSRNKALIED